MRKHCVRARCIENVGIADVDYLLGNKKNTVADYYCRFIEPYIMNWHTIKLTLYNTNGNVLCDNYCETVDNSFDDYIVYTRRYRHEECGLLEVGLFVVCD